MSDILVTLERIEEVSLKLCPEPALLVDRFREGRDSESEALPLLG
jgi:hypothetical protein